jgi:hypothetical protein
MDAIAEYRLQLKYLNGRMTPIRIRVGRPVRDSTGIWNCEALIEGGLRLTFTNGEPLPASGMGSTSWQALIGALRNLYSLIRIEGAKLYEESGRFPIHFDEVFPFPRDDDVPRPE